MRISHEAIYQSLRAGALILCRPLFRIRGVVFFSQVFRLPLPSTSRALGQFPLVSEQNVEITHVPMDRVRCPGTFQAAGNGIFSITFAAVVVPAESLLWVKIAVGEYALKPVFNGWRSGTSRQRVWNVKRRRRLSHQLLRLDVPPPTSRP